MSDMLRWSPFATNRWTSPLDALLKSPSELMDSLDRMLQSTSSGASPIRVEEFVDDKTLVVRAELPDVDPEKNIEVTVTEGILNIRAERQEKEEHKDKDRFRSEFRYGSFSRSIPLPEGVNEEDIKASYTDGVLEVRAPLPEKAIQYSTAKKLDITRG